MSRIGKLPVTVPSGVEVKFDAGEVLVKGPKGELRQRILSDVVDVTSTTARSSSYEGRCEGTSERSRIDAHANREHGRGREQGLSQEPRDQRRGLSRCQSRASV